MEKGPDIFLLQTTTEKSAGFQSWQEKLLTEEEKTVTIENVSTVLSIIRKPSSPSSTTCYFLTVFLCYKRKSI